MAKSEPALIAIAYRYFMAVAELGSVRAAAQDLNVAASAISRQLILLETALGNRLFDPNLGAIGKVHCDVRFVQGTEPGGPFFTGDGRIRTAINQDPVAHPSHQDKGGGGTQHPTDAGARVGQSRTDSD